MALKSICVEKHLSAHVQIRFTNLYCTGDNHNCYIINYRIYVTGYRYITHLYCLAVQAGFYSDAAVECRTLSPADRVLSPVGENVICIFSLLCAFCMLAVLLLTDSTYTKIRSQIAFSVFSPI